MTTTYMQDSFYEGVTSSLNLVGDTDDLAEPSSKESRGSAVAPKATKRAANPRVQVLRLASIPRRQQQRGIPGATPPFLPSAPSLLRFDQSEEGVTAIGRRKPSPLRNLTLSTYSASVNSRYDSLPRYRYRYNLLTETARAGCLMQSTCLIRDSRLWSFVVLASVSTPSLVCQANSQRHW